MFICNEVFTFVSTKEGVTRDGEKYFVIDVIGKNNKKKFSFYTKNGLLIDEFKELKFTDFQDVELSIKFYKEFNSNTRYSRWVPELIGIGRTRNFE